MGLADFVSRIWYGAEALDRPVQDPMDPRFWGVDSTATMAGVAVTWKNGLQLDVVQACLSRLSGTVSTLPLMLYQRSGEDGDERTEARDHPLFRLLHRKPNAYQTAQEFRADLMGHLAWWRNSYCRIVADPETDHPVGSLEPIHPSLLNKINVVNGRRQYVFNRVSPQVGTYTLDQDEVWHIRMAPLTPDGLMGQPVFDGSREVIARALAVEQFASLYFRNGGSGGGVIELPGGFKDKEEADRFLAVWRSGGGGLNRHADRLLQQGAKYTPIQVKNDEAQFIETKKEMGVSICRLWGMPPHMAGILDKATFSNIEQQSVEYVVYTLAPFINAIEQAAWRDLLIGDEQDRYFVEHNVAGLLRGDWKTRWTGYALGRQWGWLSVNDIRALENMAPVDGGDAYLTPLNMVPAAPGPVDPAAADDDKPQEDDNAP